MKDRMKKLLLFEIKGIPHEYQWAAFLLPVFLLSVAFASWKIHPVGLTSILTNDLYHQYAPILAEIRDKIWSGQSLFYTWNMGLGTNFWLIFTYNGASPLNAILLLFPQTHLADGITLLILLRTGLSGLFFSMLLKKKDGVEGPVSLALSTSYALCGFVLSYFWAVMWMDTVVLLPLVILGLWKMMQGEKPRLYVIALFLTVMCNFYTGFFVCLFLLLFAPVMYLEARHKGLVSTRLVMTGLRCAFYSILAVGMTAVFILPAMFSLKNTAAAANSISLTGHLDFGVFDFVSRFLLHADPVIRDGLPNVYCGVAILMLVPLFAVCKTVSRSFKIACLTLVAVLYLSMNSTVLNFFWHGMIHANQLPYRQAFLLCFLLLYIAGQVYIHASGIPRKAVFFTGVAVLCYLVILENSGDVVQNYWIIYGSGAFVLVYTAILSYFFGSANTPKRAHKLFLYAVILELFLASEFALGYIAETENLSYYPSFGQHADEMTKDLAAEDDIFSRAVIFQPQTGTGNDGALYHVKTVSIYSSTAQESLVRFLGGLGFANDNLCEVSPDGITEVSARLLGIRYSVLFTGGISVPENGKKEGTQPDAAVLGTSTFDEKPKADIIYSGYEITEYESVLSVGFYVPSAQMQAAFPSDTSPFEQTNDWFVQMGADAVYEKNALTYTSSNNIQQSLDTDTFMIEASGLSASIMFEAEPNPDQGDVLLYVGTEQKMSVHIIHSQEMTGDNLVKQLTPKSGQIMNCGSVDLRDGETMTIQIIFAEPIQESIPIACYSVDGEALDDAMATLGSQPLLVTQYDASHLTGTVCFAQSGYLLTTIPFDTGWSVQVDGVSVKTQTAFGALLMVPVAEGYHKIAFTYVPTGFVPGLLITILLTVDFVFLCVWDPVAYFSRRRTRKQVMKELDQKEEKE